MSQPVTKEIAYHEAGHALERWIVHGRTGAIERSPTEGSEAGAETEPLPRALKALVEGPEPKKQTYSEEDRARLAAEIKTSLGGCVAEEIVTGRPVAELLFEPGNGSDEKSVYGLAGILHSTSTKDRDDFVTSLTAEVHRNL